MLGMCGATVAALTGLAVSARSAWPVAAVVQTGEDGQSLVEYGLIISLVGLAAAAALSIFGGSLGSFYELFCGEVVGALGGSC